MDKNTLILESLKELLRRTESLCTKPSDAVIARNIDKLVDCIVNEGRIIELEEATKEKEIQILKDKGWIT